MIDNKILYEEIEKRGMIKARIFKRILTEYKAIYDQVYYTSYGLSRWQKAAIYKKAYKLLKKDLKQINKVDKAARREAAKAAKK